MLTPLRVVGIVAGCLLAALLLFTVGCGLGVLGHRYAVPALTAPAVPDVPMPLPAMPAPDGKDKGGTVRTTRVEVLDGQGRVMMVLTGEGGQPVVIVNDGGRARKLNLAELARKLQ